MILRTLFIAALAALIAGCSTLTPDPDLTGPIYTPANIRGPASWPADIRRVAVLPAHDATGRLTREFVLAYDISWSQALDHSQRAEFVTVDRRKLSGLTRQDTLLSTDPMPDRFLARIANATGAQAVLFLDLTHVTPYPPLSLGFRAKLVSVATGKIIWNADELFDASNALTARGARRFSLENAQGSGDATAAVLQSPARFSTYAFQAITDRLPPRISTTTP